MPPAARTLSSALDAALADVHAILTDLLVLADQQYAAAVADDRTQLDSVTRQQEGLSARLARAEARRVELTGGEPMSRVLAGLPPRSAQRLEARVTSMGEAVRDLKRKHTQTASLLETSSALVESTLDFLQRLVSSHTPAYGSRALVDSRVSLVVDSRV